MRSYKFPEVLQGVSWDPRGGAWEWSAASLAQATNYAITVLHTCNDGEHRDCGVSRLFLLLMWAIEDAVHVNSHTAWAGIDDGLVYLQTF